jgi:nitrate reductase (cytochrome), electron transfer subunit
MKRAMTIAVVALLSAAGVGFLAGTREEWPSRAGYRASPGERGPGVPARTYEQLREDPLSPNDQIYQASRDALIGLLPRLTDPVPPRDEQSRLAALERRSARRAFDGAPPGVPHRVDARAEPNCLVCHEHGAKIGELVAPAVSHPAFVNCSQCHVEMLPPQVITAGVATETYANEFAPEAFGGRGTRAWQGAPPTVPHRTFMRQRCDSCHGVSGAAGLRTQHPERQSCLQCHSLNDALDPNFSATLTPGPRSTNTLNGAP